MQFDRLDPEGWGLGVQEFSTLVPWDMRGYTLVYRVSAAGSMDRWAGGPLCAFYGNCPQGCVGQFVRHLGTSGFRARTQVPWVRA